MATVNVYHQEDNRTYQVNFNLTFSVLDRVGGSPTDATYDYYLVVTTTIRKVDGTSFPQFVVRSLADVPPGFTTAPTFTHLVDYYVEYFLVQSQFTLSSSSSSESSNSSSFSSLSSSSVGRSSSSSNSSSSSSTSSNSSSSSEQNSSSSSSS